MSVKLRIRNYIVEAFFTDGFADDDSFLKEGIVDSMGMVQLVAFLEESFSIKVDDDELIPDNLDSLSRVTAFVLRKQRRVA